MGSFLDAVRSGRIPSPVQRKFSSTDWAAAFRSFEEQDDDDARVFSSGCVVHEWLETVRKNKPAPIAAHRSNDFARRVYVGLLNWQDQIAKHHLDRSTRPQDGRPVRNAAGLSALRAPIGVGGASVPIIGSLEQLVDAARFQLGTLTRSDQRPVTQESRSLEISDLKRETTLAGLYQLLENTWSQVLWLGYRVSYNASNEMTELEPPTVPSCPPGNHEGAPPLTDYDFEVLKTLGWYRHKSILEQLLLDGVDIAKANAALRTLLAPYRIVVERRRGRGLVPRVLARRRTPAASDTSMLTALLSALAAEPYLRDLLNLGCPALQDATLNNVLQAWQGLAVVATKMALEFKSADEMISVADFVAFAPQIRKRELVRFLAKFCRVSVHQAERILSLFTFGDFKDDIWLRPLIPNGDNFLVVVPAATVPNLERSLGHWLKQSGLEESDRGPAFEKFIRQTVRDAMHNGRFAGRLHVAESTQIRLGNSGQVEEIDLLFLLDGVLFVAECKSTSFPVEPLDELSYRRMLEDARRQAVRKAEFVEVHADELSSRYLGTAPDAIQEAHPIVIVSQPMGAGCSATPTIVDHHMLSNFFADARVDLLSERRPDGSRVPGQAVDLHSLAGSLGRSLLAFAQKPPQVEILRGQLTTRRFPSPLGIALTETVVDTRRLDQMGEWLHGHDSPVQGRTT